MSNRTESRIWSICGSIWSELGVPTGMGSLELPVLMLPGVVVLLVLVSKSCCGGDGLIGMAVVAALIVTN